MVTTNIIKDKYSPEKIDRLRLYLQQVHEDGFPLYYEIKVDDLMVVPKTNNPALFEKFQLHLDDDSLKVSIYIYKGNSNYSDKYHFYINAKSKEEAVQLSGLEDNSKQNQLTENQLQKRDISDLQGKISEQDEKLRQAEEYITTLESEVEKFRGKKFHMGDINLAELSSIMLEGIIRRNTHLLAQIPGAESLAGVIENDNKTKKPDSAENANASFSKESDFDPLENLPDHVRMYISFMEQLADSLEQEQLDELMEIINHVKYYPDKIKTIKSLLIK